MFRAPSGELQGQNHHKLHQRQATAKSLPNDEQLHINGVVSNCHNEGEFVSVQ